MAFSFMQFLNERIVHFKKMVPLSITFFIYLLGWGFVSPIFNIRVNDVTGSLSLSGIIFSLVGLVGVFSDPLVGLFCDRYNIKKMIQFSLVLYSIVFLMYSIAGSFEFLFITRLMHAFALSLLWTSGWTLTRRLTKGRYAQEEISAWSSVQNMAYILGPIIGGLIITIYSWQSVFYLGSVFSIISLLYFTFKVKMPVNHNSCPKTFKEQWHSFFKDPSVAYRLIALNLVLFIASTSFYSFLPIHLVDTGVSIEGVAIILALSTTVPYILFPIVIGVVADNYGRKIPTLFGLLFMALGLIFFTWINTFTQFLFYTFVIYTGVVFIQMSINAELNDMVSEKEVGGFTGIFEGFKDFGILIGPLVVGFISAVTSITFSFLILGAVCTCSIIVLKGFKNF
ncbi:MFS transporter [archaeon]|nr:MFS transporter [archaeon]